MKRNIPMFRVAMSPEVNSELLRVIHSGWIGQGPAVKNFEEELSYVFANKKVLTLSSGTHGLSLALRLCDVKPGDEVISTPLTCTATNMPILGTGADIVWADVNKDLNIDPKSIKESITDKTRAIVVVHWGGYPCDMEDIHKIALDTGIPIIEDAAHAYGSSYQHHPIGDCSFSDFTMFSFQAIKHLTCVDGGALCCSQRYTYDRGKLLRWYGIDRESPRTDFRCIHPLSLLKLPDGSTMKAKDVYENKVDYLLSIDENGEFKKGKVKNWYKNDRGDRYFLKLVTKGSNPNKVMVTNDHEILTKDGYKKSEELNIGDMVATSYPEPSDIQKSIIIGSLLGDATLTSKSVKRDFNRAVLQENHSLKQKEYSLLKANSLNGLGINIIERDKEYYDNSPNGRIMFSTKSLPFLGEYRKLFYNDNKKIIPRELLEKEWNDMILAVLFMDDGRTQVKNQIEGIISFSDLNLMGFSNDDCEWFSEFLSGKGYDNKHKDGRLFFNKKGTDRLLNNISVFVPNSMRYKVAHLYMPFNDRLWGDGKSSVYYDELIVKERIENGYKNYKSVYCFEVEEYHNFCCNGIVVHNCEDDIAEWGYKFHMNDVCATIGMENMELAQENINVASNNAAYYEKELANVSGIELPQTAKDRQSSYWLFSMLVDRRSEFTHMMGRKGIAVSRVHERNDKHTCFDKYKRELPGLESIMDKMICIPVGWWISQEDREYIVESIKGGW